MANSQKSGNSSDVILGSLWAEGAIIANTCYDYAEEWGSLMGTAFVARDLMTLVDAFEDDGMLRYWGKSSHPDDEMGFVRLTIYTRILLRYNPRSNCCFYVP